MTICLMCVVYWFYCYATSIRRTDYGVTEFLPIDPVAASKAIVDLWNRRLGAAFPLDERLLLQQLRMERKPSLCLAALDRGSTTEGRLRAPGPRLIDPDDRLIGAALVKADIGPDPEGKNRAGYLSFIVVDESQSRRGIGSGLLEGAESWLSGRGVGRLELGGDSYHFFPGQPLDGSSASTALGAFLDARGFETGEEPIEEDLIANLSDLDWASLAGRSPLAAGYRFRFYEASLREALEEFLAREFPGRWRSDTVEALEAGMRELDLTLLQEETSGAIVGFSRIYDSGSPILGPGLYWRELMGKAPGALGPIGIAESARGRGLGLALLRLCMEELAKRGVRAMVIDWTSLGAFYAKMGFAPWKAYRYRSKALPEGRRLEGGGTSR
jgi:ribosomal protein S18 acetylase RimI-like enzyme